MTKLIRKISVKTVFGGKAEVLPMVMASQDTSHAVMRVAGIVNDFKTGEGDNGPWVGARGRFLATNLVTGEQFSAPVCFLPDAAMDLVRGSMPEQGSLEFGFDIHANYNAASITSYEYTATPLIEPSENDPLQSLMAAFEAKAPIALPEPKKEALTDDTKETKSKK